MVPGDGMPPALWKEPWLAGQSMEPCRYMPGRDMPPSAARGMPPCCPDDEEDTDEDEDGVAAVDGGTAAQMACIYKQTFLGKTFGRCSLLLFLT